MDRNPSLDAEPAQFEEAQARPTAIAARPLDSRLDRYVMFDRINRPYMKWQVDQFLPHVGQRVLEIGCGIGSIIDLIGPRELVVGLDVEPEILAYTAERFRSRPECHFELLNVTEAPAAVLETLRQNRFDTIICINVLEHIRDDIAALQKMEELLVPGGSLALLIPAHLGLYGPYDKLDGHFRRYSKPYLRTILGHTRLRALKLNYFNAVGAVGWWTQYRLLKRKIHGQGQFGIMNRLVPIMRAVEAIIAPPFGLSLVAICRKEDVE